MAADLEKTLLTLFDDYNHIFNSKYLRTEDGFEDSEDSENTMEKINTRLNQIDSRLYNIEEMLKELLNLSKQESIDI